MPTPAEPRKTPAPADTGPNNAPARPGQPPAHEDSVLESLGKAVSAPVRGAADEEADTDTEAGRPGGG